MCNDVGMELTTVDDTDEDQWLTQHLFNTGLFNDGPIFGVWIGYQGIYNIVIFMAFFLM